MKTVLAILIGFALSASAQIKSASTNFLVIASVANTDNLQRLIEERDWLARFSKFYAPEFWINYKGTLYFLPKTDEQTKCFEALFSAVEKYKVLTNKSDRYALVETKIVETGLSQFWQNEVLVPRSNPQKQKIMLPMYLDKPLCTMGRFKLFQSFENGDALIKDDDESIYYVYDLGRAVDDKYYLNAEMFREGIKTYTTAAGSSKTVDAFVSVSINKDQRKVLEIISERFSAKVAELSKIIDPLIATKIAAEAKAKSLKANQAAADKGDAFGLMRMGERYRTGDGVEKDLEKARSFLQKAADAGSETAKSELADLLAKGK